MKTKKDLRESGVVTGVTRLEEGYSIVEIRTSHGEARNIKVVFFGYLDTGYEQRSVDFYQHEDSSGRLIQTLNGPDFEEKATTEKDQRENFRTRAEFIPQLEFDLNRS
jgi:hypothetical protein